MNKLECINISKSFVVNNESLNVLKNINLSVTENLNIAISGKSGAGKSTLLHIMAGLDKPSSGLIKYNKKSLLEMKNEELSKTRLLNFGFVYQFHHLLDDLTIAENIHMPLMLNNNLNKSTKLETIDIMKYLDIYKRKDHLPWKLSGGEKQRAAIARALINNPKFLFLDEPTGNLDHENANHIHDLLIEMSNSRGIALITATHDNEFIKLFKNVYNLENSILSALNE
ncbi:MAG: ABC transporter [Gammaproteobacteria bacterium]|nr:ABC transporter [Gammaproteobacteria bacterium]|tara:strand:- start:3542 stop:4222 length:681 start_codon:yes stop_codon:yes gene_type:complete